MGGKGYTKDASTLKASVHPSSPESELHLSIVSSQASKCFHFSGELGQLYGAALMYSAPLTCQAKNDFCLLYLLPALRPSLQRTQTPFPSVK